MKHIKYWLSSKRRQMAKLHDLQRQLQEAWDESDTLGDALVEAWDAADVWKGYFENKKEECQSITKQLHRVSRERYQERELRLAAEDRRDVYLAELANEEE